MATLKENSKATLKKINEAQKAISRQVREKTIGYILAAMGLVVALAWNDAIKNFIEYLFPLNKDSIWVKFIYASIVTFLIVIVTIIFTRKTESEVVKK